MKTNLIKTVSLIATALPVVAFAGALDTWQPFAIDGSGGTIWQVAHGPGIWGAVSDNGKLFQSTDGTNWTTWTVPLVNPSDQLHFYGIAYGNGRFVGVGRDAAGVHESVVAVLSADGTIKQTLRVNPPDILWVVEHLNAEFVAAGSAGYVLRSTNGLQWSYAGQIPTGGVSIRGLAYAAGRYVATQVQGSKIWSSTNLQNWNAATIADATWQGLVQGGGRFVAVGAGGEVVWSSDGLSWKGGAANPSLGTPQAIHYAFGRYFLVNAEGELHESSDLKQWKHHRIAFSLSPTALVYNGAQFLVSHASGGGWLSGDVCGLEPLPPRLSLLPVVRFLTSNHHHYRLEGSTDLKEWSTLADFQGDGLEAAVTDTNAPTTNHRFYKLQMHR